MALWMVFCVMNCLVFSVALLMVEGLASFPVDCVVYRVINCLVLISALLVVTSMMPAMVSMVRISIQARQQGSAHPKD